MFNWSNCDKKTDLQETSEFIILWRRIIYRVSQKHGNSVTNWISS